MYHLDFDFFHYQIEYTKELLKLKDRQLVDKMNQRLVTIPWYSELKIFKKSLQSIVRLTVKEYKNLMKVMVFIIDELYDKKLSKVYIKWNKMYMMSRLEEFTESDLIKFQVN